MVHPPPTHTPSIVQGPGAHYEQLAVETASQAEECLEYMVSTAQSEKYALVLLDSITGLTPFGGDVKVRRNGTRNRLHACMPASQQRSHRSSLLPAVWRPGVARCVERGWEC